MSETIKTKWVSEAKPSVDLPINDLEQHFAYVSGNVSTITVEYPTGSGQLYVQTFTYAGSNVIDISQFVPQ